jgi:hypothetical protein
VGFSRIKTDISLVLSRFREFLKQKKTKTRRNFLQHDTGDSKEKVEKCSPGIQAEMKHVRTSSQTAKPLVELSKPETFQQLSAKLSTLKLPQSDPFFAPLNTIEQNCPSIESIS